MTTRKGQATSLPRWALGYLGSPLIGAIPIVVIALRLLLGISVPFLELSEKLIFFTGDLFPVVIGEFTPLLAHLSLELFPVALYLI